MRYEGYNSNIEFMTGKDKCPSGPLFSNPEARAFVTAKMLELPQHQRMQRFPGGTVSRTWDYSEEDVDAFANYCLGIQAPLAFVINVNNIAGSIYAINQFISHGVDIVLLEFGNEEYAPEHQRPPKGWGERIKAWLDPKGWNKVLGKEYGERANIAKAEIFRDTNFYSMPPFAVCVKLLNTKESHGWMDGIRQVFNIEHIVLHRYRFFNEDFLKVMNKHFPKFRDYKVWATEVNMSYKPNYTDKAYSFDHRIGLSGYVSFLRNQSNVMTIMVHSIWGHNLFERFSRRNNIVTDKYKNWY